MKAIKATVILQMSFVDLKVPEKGRLHHILAALEGSQELILQQSDRASERHRLAEFAQQSEGSFPGAIFKL